MIQLFRTMMMLALALGLAVGAAACGDDTDDTNDTSGDGDSAGNGGDGDHAGHMGDGDGDHAGHMGDGDGDHDHTSCGLQENCDPNAPELSSMPGTGDGPVRFMIHDPSEYGTNEETGWVEATMMVHFMDGDGNDLADTDVTLYTFSEDCGHKGPTPDVTGTTNDGGMIEFMATFTHGGPWSIVAEVTGQGTEDEIGIELCVPGSEHGGGDDSMHMENGDGDHSMHME